MNPCAGEKKYSNEELDFHGRQCLGVKKKSQPNENIFYYPNSTYF
jgi:hypothetical protein